MSDSYDNTPQSRGLLIIDYRKSPGAVYNMVTFGAVLGTTLHLK